MSSSKLEVRLQQLRRRASDLSEDEAFDLIEKALGDPANLIVAEAAKLAASRSLTALIPVLLRSFDSLFQNPVKRDAKCWAKTAIVQALTALEYDQAAPFLRGLSHVQMEPVWGGNGDAAAELRASSVLGLVQTTDVGRTAILTRLVDAMADEADPVRVEAVRGVAEMGGDESLLLLRLKARLGDPRARVLGHVFDGILSFTSDSGVALVGGYLDAGDPGVRDEAALALGSSRLPDAVDALIARAKETTDPELRDTLFRALSASRRPKAIEFLVETIRAGMTRDARAALEALSIHRGSAQLQQQIDEACSERTVPLDR